MEIVLEALSYAPEQAAFILRGRGQPPEGGADRAPVPVTYRYLEEDLRGNAVLQLYRPGQSAAPETPVRVVLTVPLDEADLPLVGLSVELPDWLVLSDEIEAFLVEIFPRDDREYERAFIRQVQRFKNRSIQYFVAAQISQYFPGLRAYRVAGAVVMAYKAIELKNETLQQQALTQVDEHLRNIHECPVDWHPRRNGQHLATSLLLVKWHLELAMGRQEAYMETLRSCRNYAKSDLASYFTPAHNLSLSLLMLCVITRLEKGPEAAREIADESFVLFQKAVRDSALKINLFSELGVSNRATYSCLLASEKKPPAKSDYDSWVRQALRVKGDDATEMVAQVLQSRLVEVS